MAGSYNLLLVAISCAIAILAAYTIPSLAEVVKATERPRDRRLWIGGGAVALGIGVWAMHFIGMFAFMLPVPLNFDPLITLLSLLPAIFASIVVISTVAQPYPGRIRLLLSGTAMGAGIGAMHYIGMAAMRLNATMLYDPLWFGVSILVAVVLATIALFMMFAPDRMLPQYRIQLRFISPVFMGLAIATMHYTGMYAAHFFPSEVPLSGIVPNLAWLVAMVSLVSVLIMLLLLLVVILRRQVTEKNQLSIEVLEREQLKDELVSLTEQQAEQISEQIEQLKDNQAYLEEIINNLNDGLITIDENGQIEQVNHAAERLFGYDKAELIGGNVRQLMPEPHRSDHDSYLQNYLHGGQAKIIGIGRELEGLHKNGTLIPMYLSVSETRVDNRRVFTGIVHDISQQKQTEQELVEAKEKSEAAARAKSDFVANMSHEIRTPLNGVLGMLELLEGTSLDRRQHDFVETARSSGNSLLRVISDILDFSKLESSELSIRDIPFDIRSIVEDIATQFAREAADKGIELHTLIAAEVPKSACGDPERIRQVLTNLVDNAIKFTEQGEINITVNAVNGVAHKVGLWFEVKDTGIGIAPDQLDSLFEAFTQQDSSTTRQFGGSGLGLTLCRQIVDLMGGEMGANSNPGAGSAFWFKLHLLPVAQEDEPDNKVIPESLRVLVVDDNKTNRDILSYYMQCWNVDCDTAVDGDTALSLLRQARVDGSSYDVAILDYHMPNMNGLQLVQALSAEDLLPSSRVVMLSSVYVDETEFKQLGITSYLVKPVRQSEIFNVLMQVTGVLYTSLSTIQTDNYGKREADLSFHNAKILLVDDMRINQVVGQEMLRDLGISAELANNGNEALDALNDNDYDLVLMDCQMPVMDGFEATGKIRSNQREQGVNAVPIIALTAHALEGDREACLAAGMNDYLSKPFTKADLAMVIARWLPAKRKQYAVAGVRREIPELQDFDPAVLERLFDLVRLRGLLRQEGLTFKLLLDAFTSDALSTLPLLREAVAKGDAAAMGNAAHGLKGASLGIGASALADLCQMLEVQAMEGRVQEPGLQLDRICAEYDSSMEVLNALGK